MTESRSLLVIVPSPYPTSQVPLISYTLMVDIPPKSLPVISNNVIACRNLEPFSSWMIPIFRIYVCYGTLTFKNMVFDGYKPTYIPLQNMTYDMSNSSDVGFPSGKLDNESRKRSEPQSGSTRFTPLNTMFPSPMSNQDHPIHSFYHRYLTRDAYVHKCFCNEDSFHKLLSTYPTFCR